MPKFSITPLLCLPDDTLVECCETCADREFPGWRVDVDDTDYENLEYDEDFLE